MGALSVIKSCLRNVDSKFPHQKVWNTVSVILKEDKESKNTCDHLFLKQFDVQLQTKIFALRTHLLVLDENTQRSLKEALRKIILNLES